VPVAWRLNKPNGQETKNEPPSGPSSPNLEQVTFNDFLSSSYRQCLCAGIKFDSIHIIVQPGLEESDSDLKNHNIAESPESLISSCG
jgi:hypothetical protein